MRSSIWGQKESWEEIPTQGTNTSLEPSGSQSQHLVRRRFVLEDLVLKKVETINKEEDFLASFLLSRSEGGQSGKNQIPEAPPTYLNLKVGGKELSLLSGLLNREIEIHEERHSSPKILDLERELRGVREELESLERENQTLKQFLMETQRPRRVS